METQRPVNKLERAEREVLVGSGARSRDEVTRAFVRARIALLLVVTLASLPSPFSPFLGGSVEAPWWEPGSIALLWAALTFWSARRGGTGAERAPSGAHLLIDVVALTVLLGLGGAAQNPFTMLYFVPIALSTLVSQAWTWAVASASVIGFAGLLVVTALAAGPHAHHGHFFHHVVGMAVALGVAGALVTYFVHRIARALSEQRSEIVRLNREREQDRYATSLGALAAGAAHELGTPLGTVQLLVGELDAMESGELQETQRSIEGEIQRMKSILHGMTSSQLSAQVLAGRESWRLSRLQEEFSRECAVKLEIQEDLPTTQPRVVLSQILRELIRNAERATRGASSNEIKVQLSSSESGVSCLVEDRGVGMNPAQLARAFEPFVSETGGHGLGLFLAQVHARQLGGRIELESEPGRGTRIWLHLPSDAPTLALGEERT